MLGNHTQLSYKILFSSILIIGLCFSVSATQADIELSLTGYSETDGSQTGWYGDTGLFLGPDFNHPNYDTGPFYYKNGYREYFNWRWDDLQMTIFDGIGDDAASAGDALISGEITRMVDVMDGHDVSWGITIELSGLQFRTANTMTSPVYHDDIIADLAGNPLNSTGYGYEWTSLSLTLTPPTGYTGGVDPDGWIGFAMPNMGHPNVAELHYDSHRGLTFEAWYMNPTTSNPTWYNVGDSKADVTMLLPHGGVIVPVPASIWTGLTLLSAMGIVSYKRKATPIA